MMTGKLRLALRPMDLVAVDGAALDAVQAPADAKEI